MRSVRLRWFFSAVAALALVLAACSTPQTPQPAQPDNPVVSIDGYQARIDMSKLDLAPMSFRNPPRTSACTDNVAYAQVVVPMLGRDSTGKWVPYVDVFWMPRGWNHKLALYAHGYIAPSDPSFLDQLTSGSPSAQPLLQTRDLLLCQGYALGASSFSAQGYAVKEGIIDTHLLNAVFPFIFWRRPDKTYVFGSSMGGLITVALAELFPRRYDGAMPTCGPVAGSLAEFAYIGNVRLVFDTAFPAVLNGTLTSWEEPEPTWVQDVLTAISATPEGQAAFAALVNTKVNYSASLGLPLLQTPLTFADPTDPLSAFASQVSSNALLHALRYHVEGAGDVIARGGGSPFMEASSYGALSPAYPYYIDPYAHPPYPVDPASPTALAYYTLFYQPSGKLRVPTLSLHNPYDPDVPYAHEEIYRQLVAANGLPGILHLYKVQGPIPSDLLAQLPAGTDPTQLTRYGHCNILPTDLVAGFDALATNDYSGLNANSHFEEVP